MSWQFGWYMASHHPQDKALDYRRGILVFLLLAIRGLSLGPTTVRAKRL
jgi:hypothetical protein